MKKRYLIPIIIVVFIIGYAVMGVRVLDVIITAAIVALPLAIIGGLVVIIGGLIQRRTRR